MNKTGEIYIVLTGKYLVESQILNIHAGHKYLVSWSPSKFLSAASFKPVKSFKFKKDALAFINQEEEIFKHSKEYAKHLLESGFITEDEYKQKLKLITEDEYKQKLKLKLVGNND